MGDLDGSPGIASLFINTYESKNAWLDVLPLDADGKTMAIDTKVEVTVDGLTHLQYAGLAQGHTSQSLVPVHFGLGETERADVVEITWPSGKIERLENVEVGQVLRVSEPR
jgi:hypothetical protein